MAEAATGAASVKKERVVQLVTMTDGRKVEFVGSTRVNKDFTIDEAKVQLDEAGGMLVVQKDAVAVLMDFINGQTRTLPIPLSLFCKFAGHGGKQKFGDELAVGKEKNATVEDFVSWIDDLAESIAEGKWSTRTAGEGGVAGAHFVIQAIIEDAANRDKVLTVEQVRKFLNDKLEAAKLRGETLTRAKLYDSFKNPNTRTGKIIKRMEDERLMAKPAVDADAELDELEKLAA